MLWPGSHGKRSFAPQGRGWAWVIRKATVKKAKDRAIAGIFFPGELVRCPLVWLYSAKFVSGLLPLSYFKWLCPFQSPNIDSICHLLLKKLCIRNAKILVHSRPFDIDLFCLFLKGLIGNIKVSLRSILCWRGRSNWCHRECWFLQLVYSCLHWPNAVFFLNFLQQYYEREAIDEDMNYQDHMIILKKHVEEAVNQ